MQLTIYRTYYPDGTNGRLYIDGIFQCYTIELPWQNNAIGHSCIPEGRYTVSKRWSEKFGDHLILADVPGRALILLHPANNALIQLRGCIAPVSKLTGTGKGLRSKAALEKIMNLVYPAMNVTPVILTIKT